MLTSSSRKAIIAAGIIAMSAGAFAHADAQEARARKPEAGHGAFQIGYIALDMGALNDALVGAGYPRFRNEYLTLGGTGFNDHGRFIVGGEGQALIEQTHTSANEMYELALSGGYGLFRLAYKVVDRPNLDVYPMFGIGGGAMRLDFRPTDAPTFGEVLANPARGSRLSAAGFMLDVGGTINYRIRLENKTKDRTGGLLIGFATGYTFMPATAKWKFENANTVRGGPSAKIQGFYARVSVGGWGRSVVTP